MPTSKQMRGLSRTERVQDLIHLSFDWAQSKGEDIDDIYVDCSQDVGHKPWTKGSVRSLTTSSEIYSSRLDRAILASEHFRLLGFGPVCLMNLSHRQVRDLSGEAMSPPCVGLCLMSILEVLFQNELQSGQTVPA